MKTKFLPKIIFGFAAIAAITAAPRASAVPVTFSGGGGTSLSFTLSQPVTYVITRNAGFQQAIFAFQNVFGGTFNLSLSGSITFSINGGPALSMTFSDSGATTGVDITPNDLLLIGAEASFTVGDVVVLSGGTLTTSGNVAAMPASGDFNTFLVGNFAAGFHPQRISTNGTTGSSVPESLSTLWLGLPLLGMFAARRLRTSVRGHWRTGCRAK